MKFAQQHRFTPEQEAEICNLYATGQHSQHALARQFGCSQGTIARILKDKPEMNVAALQRRVAELESKLRFADEYVRRLALALAEKHYPEQRFELLPDLLGKVDQIDNMTCGLTRAALGEKQ